MANRRIKRTGDDPNTGLQMADYTVSVNPRAKHVRLKLSAAGDLEVVVPPGYDRRRLPAVIATKSGWLESNRARLERQRELLPAEHFEVVPSRLCLRALDSERAVHRRADAGKGVRLIASAQALTLVGPVRDTAACLDRLRAWLRATARERLVPWLRRTSRELGLRYAKVTIRGQRTRWGSCSPVGTISLNYKLLFLPAPQVHYLLVHELCHTRHLNHSPRYWALVAEKMPDYARFDAAMKEGWRYVPRWIEG